MGLKIQAAIVAVAAAASLATPGTVQLAMAGPRADQPSSPFAYPRQPHTYKPHKHPDRSRAPSGATEPEPLPHVAPGLTNLLTDYRERAIGHEDFARFAYIKLGIPQPGRELPDRYTDSELPDEQRSLLAGLLAGALDQLPKDVAESIRGNARPIEPAPSSRLPSRPRAAAPDAHCGYQYSRSLWGEVSWCKETTAHFEVSYNVTGPRAVDLTDADGNRVPDYVEQTVKSLEYAWSRYKGFGYKIPDKADVYIGNPRVAAGVGFTPPYSLIGFPTIVMGQQAGAFYLPRHELFHLSQYEYIPTRSWVFSARTTQWWMEATAEWGARVTMGGDPSVPESERYQYARHLPEFLGRPNDKLNQWDGFGAPRQYGAFIFAEFLSARLSFDAVRQTWEHLGGNWRGQPLEAIDDTFADYGVIPSDEMQVFATANYQLCKNDPQDPNDSGWHYLNIDVPRWCDFLASDSRTNGAGSAAPGIHRPYRYNVRLGADGRAAGTVTVRGGGTAYIDLIAPAGDLRRLVVGLTGVRGLQGNLITWETMPKRCYPDQQTLFLDANAEMQANLGDRCTVATLAINRPNADTDGDGQRVNWSTYFLSAAPR
ncbi:hypothetical protein [Actinomadura litoris]|uniref:Uncharacterized protein n=1 Tax=Actinomadura litoris TaxID=2678616 RepID=A0A7K1KTM8_9ACTN|nr:hypothetical protein [Actinomadura litoris]MUN35551.1 hypothetical protein [Actinomadura litoris]